MPREDQMGFVFLLLSSAIPNSATWAQSKLTQPASADSMRRTATPNSLNAAVAVLLSFVLALEGCSVAIAVKDRIGPNPTRDFKEGGARAQVEEKLGEPIATETLSDGNVRAVYQYTARVNEGSPSKANLDLRVPMMLLLLEVASYGLIELVFMPIAYFSKTKRTYQKVYVYAPDGMIVESSSECIQHQATQNAEEWCSRKRPEQTAADPLTPATEDTPTTPAPEPE